MSLKEKIENYLPYNIEDQKDKELILKYMDIAIPKEMKETKTLFVEED